MVAPLERFGHAVEGAREAAKLAVIPDTPGAGGQITVVGGTSGGVAGASGAALGGPTVFAIAPKGRSIAPA